MSDWVISRMALVASEGELNAGVDLLSHKPVPAEDSLVSKTCARPSTISMMKPRALNTRISDLKDTMAREFPSAETGRSEENDELMVEVAR